MIFIYEVKVFRSFLCIERRANIDEILLKLKSTPWGYGFSKDAFYPFDVFIRKVDFNKLEDKNKSCYVT